MYTQEVKSREESTSKTYTNGKEFDKPRALQWLGIWIQSAERPDRSYPPTGSSFITVWNHWNEADIYGELGRNALFLRKIHKSNYDLTILWQNYTLGTNNTFGTLTNFFGEDGAQEPDTKMLGKLAFLKYGAVDVVGQSSSGWFAGSVQAWHSLEIGRRSYWLIGLIGSWLSYWNLVGLVIPRTYWEPQWI